MKDQKMEKIVLQLVSPGKGILASDESFGTIKKRFEKLGIESTKETRRDYRELLYTTPGIEKYISGVIMFDETIRQSSSAGKKFTQILQDRDILIGIKVDQGKEKFFDSDKENITVGLGDLESRLKEYLELGASFAKWRSVFYIDENLGLPSEKLIEKNSEDLANYAKICQSVGVVPIVEPEVLMEGAHPIDVCASVSKKVFEKVFEKLILAEVDLSKIILKPNMIVEGNQHNFQNLAETVAEKTIQVLRETVSDLVEGVAFLSGGQDSERAMANLNAMNSTEEIHPWELTFSFGRALQNPAMEKWAGKEENKTQPQELFLQTCKKASLSASGERGAVRSS